MRMVTKIIQTAPTLTCIQNNLTGYVMAGSWRVQRPLKSSHCSVPAGMSYTRLAFLCHDAAGQCVGHIS